MLSAALTRLETNQMPNAIDGVAKEMFDTLRQIPAGVPTMDVLRTAASLWRNVALGAVFFLAVDTRLRPEGPFRVGVLDPMCQ